MKLTVSQSNDQTILTLDGMLDSSSATLFQEEINRQLENNVRDLVIDLADLTYTSSQGIRTILTLIKTMMARDGKLVFRHIRPAVREVLDMAGISQAMVIE